MQLAASCRCLRRRRRLDAIALLETWSLLIQVKRLDRGLARLLHAQRDGPRRAFARDGGQHPQLISSWERRRVLRGVRDEEQNRFVEAQSGFVSDAPPDKRQVAAIPHRAVVEFRSWRPPAQHNGTALLAEGVHSNRLHFVSELLCNLFRRA